MRCLSFGWYFVFALLVILITAALPDMIKPVGGIVILGLLIWFVAGFFIKCDSNVGSS